MPDPRDEEEAGPVNVFVHSDEGYPADVRDRVLARLREKHPRARVQRLDAGKADRILCFFTREIPSYVRFFRDTGTPTVAYAADGTFEVFDEALFVATLKAELDAVEVDESAPPRRRTSGPSGFDDRRNTSRVFPVAPGAHADAVEASRAWQAEQAAKAAADAESGDDQLSLSDAIAERDEAMTRVDDAADEDWKSAADAAILATAISNPDGFTTDDVWNGGLAATRENRALGPRITAAARRGRIEKTGEYRPSTRRHATPLPVWRITATGRAAA
jgi:hypothetical protein